MSHRLQLPPPPELVALVCVLVLFWCVVLFIAQKLYGPPGGPAWLAWTLGLFVSAAASVYMSMR